MWGQDTTRGNTLHNHPLVAEVSDERGNGDGIWCYLKPGHKLPDEEVHAIHEDTVAECREKLRWVVACDCDGCKCELARVKK